MTDRSSRPPPEVLIHFNIKGPVVPLPGGQEQSWFADETVLKPAEDSNTAQWMCEVQSNLHGHQLGFRVAEPIERDGRYVFNGWTATKFVSGVEDVDLHTRLHEIMDASRAMHTVLAKQVIEKPLILSTVTHRWAHADRFAWGEPFDEALLNRNFYESEIQGYIARLDVLKRAVPHSSCQLIHGDLAGNILFDEGNPPAILDFSFYWRPVEYAEAVVLADGLTWQKFSIEEVKSVGWSVFRFQMLVRALIFRIITYAIDFDETFVQANWTRMDAERAVKMLEENATCSD